MMWVTIVRAQTRGTSIRHEILKTRDYSWTLPGITYSDRSNLKMKEALASDKFMDFWKSNKILSNIQKKRVIEEVVASVLNGEIDPLIDRKTGLPATHWQTPDSPKRDPKKVHMIRQEGSHDFMTDIEMFHPWVLRGKLKKIFGGNRILRFPGNTLREMLAWARWMQVDISKLLLNKAKDDVSPEIIITRIDYKKKGAIKIVLSGKDFGRKLGRRGDIIVRKKEKGVRGGQFNLITNTIATGIWMIVAGILSSMASSLGGSVPAGLMWISIIGSSVYGLRSLVGALWLGFAFLIQKNNIPLKNSLRLRKRIFRYFENIGFNTDFDLGLGAVLATTKVSNQSKYNKGHVSFAARMTQDIDWKSASKFKRQYLRFLQGINWTLRWLILPHVWAQERLRAAGHGSIFIYTNYISAIFKPLFPLKSVLRTAHAGIYFSPKGFYVALKDDHVRFYKADRQSLNQKLLNEMVARSLQKLAEEQDVRITSVGILGLNQKEMSIVGTYLRYESGLDIFCMNIGAAQIKSQKKASVLAGTIKGVFKRNVTNGAFKAQEAARIISKYYKKEGIFDVYLVQVDKATGEVQAAPLMSLEGYKKMAKNSEWEEIQFWAQRLKNVTTTFINSTAQGGGVALERHPIIRFWPLLEIDVHWHVMDGNKEFFWVTKNCDHNTFQARLEELLTEGHKKTLNDNWETQVKRLESSIARAKDTIVMVIDDYQPSGMMEELEAFARKYGKEIKFIFRSHIHFEADMNKGTTARVNWDFLWENIRRFAHLVVIQPTDPIEESVPPNVFEEKPTVIKNPSTDPSDDLNWPHSEKTMEDSLERFNKHLLSDRLAVESFIADHPLDMRKWFGERKIGIGYNSMTSLDLERPSIIQVARFDPAKNIPGVLEAYSRYCKEIKTRGIPEKEIPQLIIAGHGAVDDTDGMKLYIDTLDRIHKLYPDIAHDIKVARLPHNDYVLNAILRRSKIALQLSLAEGYEIKVTEVSHKGVIAIAYNVGGIGKQIIHGLTGFLIIQKYRQD